MNLSDAFRHQAHVCPTLGSPFMGRLMALFADRLAPGGAVADHLLAWPGDVSPAAQSVPLRIAGALHNLVVTGASPDLSSAYPPNAVTDDALWSAVTQAMEDHAPAILAFLASPPQTNEVRRAACLIAAGSALAARFDMPMMLSELGASAGLNLMWDRFALDAAGTRLGPGDAVLTLTPDWRGAAPEGVAPRIADRRGVDLAPIDPRAPRDAERLLSYLWPDQPERIARTRAAISVASAPVDQADAVDWLPDRLAAQTDGHLHLVYHTIAWQYLPDAHRARGDAIIAAAGARATPDRPLARLGMEADGSDPGAAITLTLWPDGQTQDLGRIDYHGRWVDWRAPLW
ncbi:DUF2332 domain-containing protein [Pseudaestuariivita atlantica]|uniref:DUF2332 domain-containing protein n=1 Tax=Pseudaestuariivita atlantica TaxID=1317121 RepID=A0A0L1JTW3_9RHOB|nr:DUF2332 family protein [Pseudaestuariivita atlantica]KNG95214.1 hypothetical protein ATO11_00800 [Pseudaestuariivita atlantica]